MLRQDKEASSVRLPPISPSHPECGDLVFTHCINESKAPQRTSADANHDISKKNKPKKTSKVLKIVLPVGIVVLGVGGATGLAVYFRCSSKKQRPEVSYIIQNLGEKRGDKIDPGDTNKPEDERARQRQFQYMCRIESRDLSTIILGHPGDSNVDSLPPHARITDKFTFGDLYSKNPILQVADQMAQLEAFHERLTKPETEWQHPDSSLVPVFAHQGRRAKPQLTAASRRRIDAMSTKLSKTVDSSNLTKRTRELITQVNKEESKMVSNKLAAERLRRIIRIHGTNRDAWNAIAEPTLYDYNKTTVKWENWVKVPNVEVIADEKILLKKTKKIGCLHYQITVEFSAEKLRVIKNNREKDFIQKFDEIFDSTYSEAYQNSENFETEDIYQKSIGDSRFFSNWQWPASVEKDYKLPTLCEYIISQYPMNMWDDVLYRLHDIFKVDYLSESIKTELQ